MPVELQEQEKLVLNVIQEYLNKNRIFNMKEILPFITARFKMASIDINNRGIEEILKVLVNKKLIVEGSKLYRDDILINKKRNIIYEFIVKNPGTYFNRILKAVNLSNHVIIWHLEILLKFEYIKKQIIEDHDIYFDFNYRLRNTELKYFTSKEKSKLIIDYLKINDIGVVKTRLSTDLKLHINTATKYLTFLEHFQVVVKRRLSSKTLFFLHDDFLEN